MLRAGCASVIALAACLLADAGRVQAQSQQRSPPATNPKASLNTEIAWLDKMSLELANGGQYAEAIALMQRALPLIERRDGPDSLKVANALMRFAELHRNFGNQTESEAMLRRALAIREKALGLDHAAVADTLNGLGLVTLSQARLAEAETLLKRALVIRQKAFGGEHAVVGQSLNNLAFLYHRLGRPLDAEPLARKALEVREAAHGPGHKNVAYTLSNLGWILVDQGKLGEAEKLMTRALAIREKENGPEHPETIQVLNGVALIHIRYGRLAQAEPLLQRALAAREKSFGADHPEITSTLSYMALLNRQRAKLAEAESLRRRILAINEKAYGPEHIASINAAGDLAVNLHSQGKNDEAEALFKRAIADRGVLGPEHPAVGRGHMIVGEFYRELGRHEEAEVHFKRALAVPKADIKQLSVVYATNRKLDATAKTRTYGGERAEQLTFGTAVLLAGREEVAVRAERRAEAGGLLDQSPAALTSERRLALRTIEPAAAESQLASQLEHRIGAGRVPPRDVLVFVHGYNVAFDDAVKRAAQIAFDLDFQGLTMLYSWPSRARLLGYGYDRDSADIATSHLAEFIMTTSRLLPDSRIHLLAHSLGNMVMLGALEKLALATRGSGQRPRIGEIVLAHPDVDRDRMRQLVRAIDGVGAGMTLYMSEDDKAMWVSKLIRGVARAGGAPVVVKGLDTIDVTGLAASIWSTNHNTFASNPVAFGDLSRLITWGRRPVDKRTALFELAATDDGAFWRYRPTPAAPRQ